MKYLSFLFVLSAVLLVAGCSHRQKEGRAVEDKEEIAGAKESEPVEVLKPLTAGTVTADEKEFGRVIELTGEQRVLDCEPFKVGEPEMWIKDGYFLMQNQGNQEMYMLFKQPDLEYVTGFGIRGKGPDEFMFPHIVPTSRKGVLACIHESTNDKLYEVGIDGSATYVPVVFEKVKNAVHSEKQLFAAENGVYYYAEYIRQGKALFESRLVDDSLHTRQLFNLAFSPKHKSWAAYVGDFVVHPEAKRLAYAYKYFKRILFFDPETGAARVVDFNKEGVTAANDIITLGPDNITYYWGGASASREYVYFTYSGRTPVDVSRENGKTDGYIFVEQFDWNGNPVRKYKLDHWGPTRIDEENGRILQLCYMYDDPLFIYHLPGK